MKEFEPKIKQERSSLLKTESRDLAIKLKRYIPHLRSILRDLVKEFDQTLPHPDGYDTVFFFPRFSFFQNISNSDFIYDEYNSRVRANLQEFLSTIHENQNRNAEYAALAMLLHEMGHHFLNVTGLSGKSSKNTLSSQERFCDFFSGFLLQQLRAKILKEDGMDIVSEDILNTMEHEFLLSGGEVRLNVGKGIYKINHKRKDKVSQTYQNSNKRASDFLTGYKSSEIRTFMTEIGFLG